jgi:hypothetical protein
VIKFRQTSYAPSGIEKRTGKPRPLNIKHRVFVLLTSLCFSLASQGQPPATQQTEGPESVVIEQEPLEEITVIAPQSIRSMYADMVQAQEIAFDLFNSLNEDNDFDVICRREKPAKDAWNPIANSWPTQVCTTPFYDREIARETQNVLNGLGNFGDAAVDIDRHLELLAAKINEVATDSPEFYEAMISYRELKNGYDVERTERMANSPLNRFFSGLFGRRDEP